MKSTFLSSFFLFATFFSFCQNFSVQRSEEFKKSRKTSMPDLIGVDESGIYLTTFKVKTKYMTTDHYDNTYTLYKFNLQYKQLFEYEYETNLKKSEVSNILLIKKNLYLFSFLHDLKEKKYTVFGAMLNKENGKIAGELKELFSFDLSEKDDLTMLFTNPSTDSSRIIITAMHQPKKNVRSALHTKIVDLELNSTGMFYSGSEKQKEVIIPTDIIPAKGGINIMIAKKDEISSKYITISGFTKEGNKLYNIKVDSTGKHLLNGKATMIDNNTLMFTGLYCTSSMKNEINGVLINKYDVLSGTLISSSSQTLPQGLFKNNGKDNEGIPNTLRLRSVSINPKTNSPVIMAEIFYGNSSTSTDYVTNDNSPVRKIKYTTNFTFVNADLMLIETDQNLKISRVITLPKHQTQKWSLSGYYGALSSEDEGFATMYSGKSLDFYSSYKSFTYKDKMIFILNDHPGNMNVKSSVSTAKPADDLSTSTTFVLTYDFNSGALTRKALFNNSGQPIPVVKDAVLIGNEIFLYARLPHLLGKSEYEIIKIIIK
jgi:hypothetical protein